MGFLIAAVVVAFFAMVLLIIGAAMVSKGKSFNENKRYGVAEVVGYERAEQSNWYTLLVRIPELNDAKVYNCTAGKINPSDYPKGKTVDIIYAPKKVAGIKFVEAHLRENPPADTTRLGQSMKKISVAMLVIAGILIVLGIVTLL